MAIPVLESSTVTKLSSAGTSFVIDMPGTRPDDDLYVCSVATADITAFTGVPSNWIEILTAGSTGLRHASYFWRGSSEPSTYTLTQVSAESAAVIHRLTGSDPDDLIVINAATSLSTINDFTPITPTADATRIDTKVLWACFMVDGACSITPTSGTEIDKGGSSNDVSTSVGQVGFGFSQRDHDEHEEVAGVGYTFTDNSRFYTITLAILGQRDVVVGGADLCLATYQYNGREISYGTTDSSTKSISIDPTGVTAFTLGAASTNVDQHTLSTAFDITTSTPDTEDLNIAASPRGLHVNIAGEDIYVSSTDDTIYHYEASTGWDITTASTPAADTLDVSSETTDLMDCVLSADGTKLIAVAFTGDLYEYTLSTPWDLSTASYSSNTFDFGSEEGTGVTADATGDNLIVSIANTITAVLIRINLSTAWDLSTATRTNDFITNPELDATTPGGAHYDSSVSKLYLTNTGNDRVRELDGFLVAGGGGLQNLYAKGAGDAKAALEVHVNDSGTVKEVLEVYINDGGDVEQVFSSAAPAPTTFQFWRVRDFEGGDGTFYSISEVEFYEDDEAGTNANSTRLRQTPPFSVATLTRLNDSLTNAGADWPEDDLKEQTAIIEYRLGSALDITKLRFAGGATQARSFSGGIIEKSSDGYCWEAHATLTGQTKAAAFSYSAFYDIS